jgi:hypothetical protein
MCSKHLFIFIPVILIYLSIACTKNENFHPTNENLHPNFDIDITEVQKKERSSSETYPGLISLASRLQESTIQTHIGKAEGYSHEMIGSVEGITIDQKLSRFLVLDSQQMGINQYDFAGNYIHSLLREGRGPGELINPSKLTLSDDSLYVLNFSFGLNRYSVSSDSLQYIDEINSPYPPLGFCLNHNQLFVYTLPVTGPSEVEKQNNVLAFNTSNITEITNKFGIMYKSDSWMAISSMSMSAGIECTNGSETVVQYFEFMNLLYGFNLDGTLKWITRLPDFNFIEITEHEDGRINFSTVSEKNSKKNSIQNLISVNQDFFIAQITNLASNENDVDTYDTYLLSYSHGNGVFLTSNWPIVKAVSDNYILFYNINNDVPQIEIASY